MSRRTIAQHVNDSTFVKSLILPTSILGAVIGLKACIKTENAEQERIDRKFGVKDPLNPIVGSWDFGWNKVGKDHQLIPVTELMRNSKIRSQTSAFYPVAIEETWPDYNKSTGYATFSMLTHLANLHEKTGQPINEWFRCWETDDSTAIAKLLNSDSRVTKAPKYCKMRID